MPELDFAILCEAATVADEKLYVHAGGFDTVLVPVVPSVVSLAVALGISFSANECGRPHRIEMILQGQDGKRHAQLTATAVPVRQEGIPVHWPTRLMISVPFAAPLPEFADYALELMIDDIELRTLNLRVAPAGPPDGTE